MTGVVHRTTDQAVVLDLGKGVEAVLAVSEQLPVRALPHRAAPEGLRARGAPHDARAGAGGEPHASRLPASPDGDGDPRDLQRHGRDPRHRPRGGQPLQGRRSRAASRASTPRARRSGQRGARIQAIVAELNGEKVDVVLWNEDAGAVRGRGAVAGRGAERAHRRGAQDRQRHRARSASCSLAIGKEGQNARLAAKLTGWRIDIRSDAGVATAAAAHDGR